MRQQIATTCVECGTLGQMQTDNAAIVHKTILCADCDDRGNPCPNCTDGEIEFTFHSDVSADFRIVPEAEIIGQTCKCELTDEQIKLACERAEREEMER